MKYFYGDTKILLLENGKERALIGCALDATLEKYKNFGWDKETHRHHKDYVQLKKMVDAFDNPIYEEYTTHEN